ncbi:MAG: hypothetical protein NZ531_04550 [Aquificaceae bacterium]|nr:hypothetical protein [Aquificaceae bacterium]
MKREKVLFAIVLAGWVIIVSTLLHDILFALKYDMKVPQVQVKITLMDKVWDSGPISAGVIERLFPFCCLSHHQPAKWVSLWERLKFLAGVSFAWFIIFTLPWILVRKGILGYNESDY